MNLHPLHLLLTADAISFRKAVALQFIQNSIASMTQFAAYMKMTNAGATNLADYLVKDGLVERGSLQGNRKVVTLVLTAKGRDVLGRVLG